MAGRRNPEGARRAPADLRVETEVCYPTRSTRGRGAASNPPNRFLPIAVEREAWEHPDDPAPQTCFLRDGSKTILARNNSPDVGFDVSINPYRGCECGCPYCYARPTHEYLGFSAGLDWETKIVVKEDAPQLLRQELSSRRWKPQVIALSGVTDPYQPIERRLKITRGCLEVLAEFRNPVAVITKRDTVTRDIDLLGELARHDAAAVSLSVTSLDRELQRVMEPRASTPERRLAAVRKLSEAGIPTGVMVAPVIPGLNDYEIPAILTRAAESGATRAAYVMLRLPYGLKELFEDWLERQMPDRKEKVLNRLRDLRGGALNDPRFGTRMKGEGPYAQQVRWIFRVAARRAGLDRTRVRLSTAAFRRPSPHRQLALFD